METTNNIAQRFRKWFAEFVLGIAIKPETDIEITILEIERFEKTYELLKECFNPKIDYSRFAAPDEYCDKMFKPKYDLGGVSEFNDEVEIEIEIIKVEFYTEGNIGE